MINFIYLYNDEGHPDYLMPINRLLQIGTRKGRTHIYFENSYIQGSKKEDPHVFTLEESVVRIEAMLSHATNSVLRLKYITKEQA